MRRRRLHAHFENLDSTTTFLVVGGRATGKAMDLAELVIRFVAREISVPETELTLETRLLEDLGVAGDDAEWLFASFAERFSVDLTCFKLSDHFPCEYMWFSRDPGFVPVTIGDLLKAAEAKKWLPRSPAGRNSERRK